MENYDFNAKEDTDGVRFTWHMLPKTKLGATRAVVPIAAMYSPLKQSDSNPGPLKYQPVRCNRSGSILNPHCAVDYHGKTWTCPFTGARNQFPAHYAAHITEQNLPAELLPQFTTVEYEIPGRDFGPPVFLFVVDTCFKEKEELDELKDSLQQSLSLLPEEAIVGLITFGKMVHVHELAVTDIPKSYCLRGNKNYTAAEVSKLIGLNSRGRRAPGVAKQSPQQAAGRFLLGMENAQFSIEQILEDLQPDPWRVKRGHRALRCTGTALGVAVGLLEATFPRKGARIMLFTSGPPTQGPGAITSDSLKEMMRSHTDIQKNNPNARFHKGALEHYQQLAARCVQNHHSIDIFACSLDQIGFLEMLCCCRKTGGVAVMADSFKQSVFRESFGHMFESGSDGNLQMGFAATLEIITTREVQICGIIGPCSSLRKANASVSKTAEIGEAGTNKWALSVMDPSTTLAVIFEINRESPATARSAPPTFQFITKYQHASGKERMRVTTSRLGWNTAAEDARGFASPMALSFDQEAAVAIMARIAVLRTQTESTKDVLRWLDRSLIRLCAKFADYKTDQPESFNLPHEFALFPQFMFHLRRSQFMQIFNCSPDETAYHRHKLLRAPTSDSSVMIQPALLRYSFAGPPAAVLLDSDSVKPDVILLLDTFFHVVIFHGATMAAWRDAGYQNKPDHANFKKLLKAPINDAKVIMSSRFPVPRYIVCDQHKSQARFLLAKLNPSKKADDEDDGTQIFTDDVSLRVFMQHLVKLAVTST